MTDHDRIQDLLEGYVDETLDRPTRKMVDAHLAACEQCRAILDEVAPIDLTHLPVPNVDERRLRRSVQRAMRRTVLDAMLMLVTVWLAGWLLTALVLQPLIVDRGGRAAAAGRATIDTAIMYNPGATLTEFSIATSWLRRTFTAEVGIPVGSTMQPAGEIAAVLGPIGLGEADGGDVFPYVGSGGIAGPLDTLDRLGEGTVATVQAWFDEPIDLTAAQVLADSTSTDARVVWAGFSPGDGSSEPEGIVYGYGTCIGTDSNIDDALLGATSANASQDNLFSPASLAGARTNVIRALDNLITHPRIAAGFGHTSVDRLAEARDAIASDGRVATLVVTGPSPEVAAFLERNGIGSGAVLAVDFYNWSAPLCGR